ncbi:MAG: N-formylglutamate amidohydrolase [Gammaproteobacteria bacterium]|nr:N-formylglutamate amidohydrolase [Gammaproteobacteria bacterium]
MPEFTIILSCEHAVNTIPAQYQAAFQPYVALLNTHQGYDIAAQHMARKIASTCHLPYVEAQTSRLLIDCNRSLSHRQCFSAISKPFDAQTKQQIIHDYYLPYREAVLSHIKTAIQEHQTVFHLSIHSFTPCLNGITRRTDIGLLYDSARPKEQALAISWLQWLKQHTPQHRIRRNYPYLGKSDGFTTYCRREFSENDYLGFEIEFNQGTLAQPVEQCALEDIMCKLLNNVNAN